jgi:hypothetical protein
MAQTSEPMAASEAAASEAAASEAARSPLDPAGFFEFDLAAGAVRARTGPRLLLLPDGVLASLIEAAVRTSDITAVRRLGRQLGESVMAELGADAPSARPEVVLGRAADVLSLFGWGRLDVELRGDALVARIAGLPALDADKLGAAALLGGLFSSLAAEEVACVPVASESAFLLVHPTAAGHVWKWSRSGEGVAAMVARLAPPEAPASSEAS